MIPSFADKYNLQSMYDNLNKYIREVDQNKIIFFESVTFDDFIPVGFSHVPGGDEFRNRSALSYHYTNVNFDMETHLKTRMGDIKRLGSGGMLTEFGLRGEVQNILPEFELIDNFLQSWIGWSYKPFGGITGDCGSLFNDDGTKVLDKVYAFSRTFPHAVAGKTKKFSFDNNSSAFQLEYEICESCGETEIFFNQELRYKDGFDLKFNNEDYVHWEVKEKNKLFISHVSGTDKKVLLLTLNPK